MTSLSRSLIISAVLLLLTSLSLAAQLDTFGFIHPVKHQIRLSGNFGELRSNHFHSGIDIKSRRGVSGDSIISIQQGHISRIKIQLAGYGKAVYVDHPNGYTSVYAHLNEFSPKIEDFIRNKQKELESYALDLYLDGNQFALNQGELVGIMGNTGMSTGPHLHFEIRDTKSEETINPLLFGFNISDKIPPKIDSISLYGLDKNKIPINVTTVNSSEENNKFYIDAWRFGIGIQAYDYISGRRNKNGIYKVEIIIDDSTHFENIFDRFSFDQTRYLNACIDYKAKEDFIKKTLLCYRQPGNDLDMYNESQTDGVIKLFKDRSRNVEIKISDVSGNTTSHFLQIYRKEKISPPELKKHDHYLKYDSTHVLEAPKTRITFPANTFYKDEMINFSSDIRRNSGSLDIGHHTIPSHKYYSIEIDVSSFVINRDKLCLVYLDGGKLQNVGGKLNKDTLVVKTNRLGRFILVYDTAPPKLKMLTSIHNLKPSGKVKVRMTDNYKTLGEAKDPSWKVTLNNNWLYSEFDIKTKIIQFEIPENLDKGEYDLKIQATDDRLNTDIIQYRFTAK